jgi:ribosome-associated protein
LAEGNHAIDLGDLSQLRTVILQVGGKGCGMKEEQQGWTIRLDDFLKREGMVGTGGEAKVRIQAGEVLVNGQVEMRRRKRLQAGDLVELLGERLIVGPDDS